MTQRDSFMGDVFSQNGIPSGVFPLRVEKSPMVCVDQ